jgi:hypothetical protein
MATPRQLALAAFFALAVCVGSSTAAKAQNPSMSIVLTPNARSASHGETVTFTGNLTFTTGSTPAKIVSGTVLATNPSLMNTEYIGPPAGVIIGNGGSFSGNLFRATPHGGPAGPRTGTIEIRWEDKNTDQHTSSAGFTVNVTPAPPALLVMLVGGLGTGFAARRKKKIDKE